MGGSVGLKGTDGVLEEAIRRGAEPKSNLRTETALKELLPVKDDIVIYTYSGSMGGDAASKLGFDVNILGGTEDNTTSADTLELARELEREGVDVILFAGGDGTARDIYTAVGQDTAVLGIPAGVKVHSPVYAQTPAKAGELLRAYISGDRSVTVQEAEVLDIDEDKYRGEIVNTRLFGYLNIIYKKELIQNKKSGTPLSESSAQEAISYEITDNMEPDTYYVIGPGTTMRAVMQKLGLPYTLIGVDIVKDGELIVTDAGEKQILETVRGKKAKLVLTVTGGQGYLLGRGNQQISAEVVKEIGADNIIVAATQKKLRTFIGQPLLVDTGDAELDSLLCRYTRVITGYKEGIMYKISI